MEDAVETESPLQPLQALSASDDDDGPSPQGQPVCYLSRATSLHPPGAQSPLLRLETPSRETSKAPALVRATSMRKGPPVQRPPSEFSEHDIPALLDRMAHPASVEDREFAAASLCNLLADFSTHEALIEADGLPVLLSLLRTSNLPPDIHYAVACALHNLTCQASNLKALIDAGGLEILVSLLQGLPAEHREALQSVVQIVRRLSFQEDPIKRLLVARGTVPAMVAIIKGEPNDVTRANAAAAIQSLSFVNERLLDDYPTAVATLIDLLLACSNKQTQDCLTGALQNFSVHGGKFMGPTIPRFTRLLRSDHPVAVKCAALVLHNLSVEPAYKPILLNSGTVPVLVRLVDLPGSGTELRLYCLGCLHYLAHSEEARPRLVEEGAVRCALDQLKETVSSLLRDHALGLLQNVAQHTPLQGHFARMGALELLVREISAPYATPAHRYSATVALNYLCFKNSTNKLLVLDAGAVPAILAALRDPQVTEKHAESLLAALQSLSVEEATSIVILDAGGLPVLLDWIVDPARCPTATEYAAGTLQNIASEPAVVADLATANGVDLLLLLVTDDTATVVAKESAAAVLQAMSLDDTIRAQLATRETIAMLLAALQANMGPQCYAMQEEILGALQNVSMYVAARAYLVRFGAVDQLADIIRQSVPSVVKERAVFTLYHISIDNIAHQQLIGKTGVLPLIEAYAWKYNEDPELRDQLVQFQDTVRQALTLPDAPLRGEEVEDDHPLPPPLPPPIVPSFVPPTLQAEAPPVVGLRISTDASGSTDLQSARSTSLWTTAQSPSRVASAGTKSKRDALQEPDRVTSLRLEVMDPTTGGVVPVPVETPTSQSPSRKGTKGTKAPRSPKGGSDGSPPSPTPALRGARPINLANVSPTSANNTSPRGSTPVSRSSPRSSNARSSLSRTKPITPKSGSQSSPRLLPTAAPAAAGGGATKPVLATSRSSPGSKSVPKMVRGPTTPMQPSVSFRQDATTPKNSTSASKSGPASPKGKRPSEAFLS